MITTSALCAVFGLASIFSTSVLQGLDRKVVGWVGILLLVFSLLFALI